MQDLSSMPGAHTADNGVHPASAAVKASLEADADAVAALPAEFIQRHRVLPVKMGGGVIVIATAAPGNQRVIQDIRLLTGLEVEEQTVDGAELLEKIAQS